jgi:broad specificity phosphatase PhoE
MAKLPQAIFIRHAESSGNARHVMKGQEDYPLDQKGIAESEALAVRVKRFKPTVVVSSPLQRASIPAEKIARAAGVRMALDPDLLPIHLGSLTGTPQETGEPKLQWAFDSRRDQKIGGIGETPNEWDARNQRSVRRIQMLVKQGERPAVVTHSRELRALPNALEGKPAENVVRGSVKPSGFVTLWPGNKLKTHKAEAS